MTFTELGVADIPQLARCAEEFYASSQFLKDFDMTRFQELWTALIETGRGVIFCATDGTGIVGTIGGVAYPDIYSGHLIATEFFWFVRDGHRGPGLRLYRSFEQWAKDRGCSQIRMVHLLDSMPEKLERVYRRFGFVPAEVHYVRELTQ